jgi:L-ascorbate metabolism protein UlaG (beta-lactamase superfamily)
VFPQRSVVESVPSGRGSNVSRRGDPVGHAAGHFRRMAARLAALSESAGCRRIRHTASSTATTGNAPRYVRAAGLWIRDRAGDRATAIRGLEPWATTRLEAPGRPTIEVTATPCRHGPPLSRPIVGHVVGFALTWPGQSHGALWISGDTVLHRELWEVVDRVPVGVALLHLGGVRFPVTGPLRYTMTVDEAVELCERLRPRTAIPVHYEGWSHFRQGREPIEQRLATAPAAVREAFRFLPMGEATTVEA